MKNIGIKNIEIDVNMDDDKILDKIFKKANNKREELYNYVLIEKYSNIDLDNVNSVNKIEDAVYKKDDYWVWRYNIMDNTRKLLEEVVNEMIKKDIDIQTNDDVWITINLDQLYNIKLIKIEEEEIRKILPKTKELDIAEKIINNNIIITTLKRKKN